VSVAAKPEKAKLERTTFKTSRLLDFCSQKELVAQTGHDADDWPLVILKELMDNALDACEEAEVAPEITIFVDAHGITIIDNGPGLPTRTIDGILDYSVRVSSREAYVAPDRGAQGNALKTVLAMPFVLDGDRGRVDISSNGRRHEITFVVDPIRQEPVLSRAVHEAENVKSGTTITVRWPDSAMLNS
jgi:DNA topoisomerase VI subunit B